MNERSEGAFARLRLASAGERPSAHNDRQTRHHNFARDAIFLTIKVARC
jgi:hypothetical protein